MIKINRLEKLKNNYINFLLPETEVPSPDKLRSTDDFEDKSITSTDWLVSNTGFKSRYGKTNPLVENIYNTIANDISLVSMDYKKLNENGFGESAKDKPLYKILTRRTNQLYSPSDFLNMMTYNLVKYGNAIAVPIYGDDPEYQTFTTIDGYEYTYKTSNSTIKELEVLDVSQMKFGFGYSEDGQKFLLYKRIMYKESEYGYHSTYHSDLHILPYRDIVHIRYIPSAIFDGDNYVANNFNRIADLIDTRLDSMIQAMVQGSGISGVLKLKAQASKDDGKKAKLQRFKQTFLENNDSKIAVLDELESFEPLSRKFEISSSDDVGDVLDILYKSYGISESILSGEYNEQQYSAYYNRTLEPIINRMTQEFNYKLVTDAAYARGYRIKFNKKLIIGANLKDITSFMDKAIYHQVANPNTVADMLGLPTHKNGNDYFTNANAINVTNNTNGTGNSSEPPEGGEEDEEETT